MKIILLILLTIVSSTKEDKCLGIYVQPPPYENGSTSSAKFGDYYKINITFTMKVNKTKCDTINYTYHCKYYSFNTPVQIKCYKDTKKLYLNIYTYCKIENCKIITLDDDYYLLLSVLFLLIFFIFMIVISCVKDKYKKRLKLFLYN